MIQIELVDPKEYPKFLLQYQSNIDFHHLYSSLKQNEYLVDGVKFSIYEAVGNQSVYKYYCIVQEVFDERFEIFVHKFYDLNNFQH